ncbi:hypothetical protein AJ80_00909 [Polytolypa hystricis UAMH7299]|uniref:CSC1/OSCA1-like 7TM region domain-containing protein n=1 Tax=Polytolypa hystricis (strain UAMH7299) TaxID=1447883 RepID=A0A2B7Z268_POLH7|nr:hypothetical protein AJ80_00909 [Polytolypa hystricis UAMH7299]
MEGMIVVRQGGDSLDDFLNLIQNPFKSAFRVDAIWASLGTSLGITIALALVFSLFRPRNSVVYAPKVKHADRKHAPPPVGKGMFAWIMPIVKTKENELIDRIGLDATIFLRFTRMCRNIFLTLSFFGCVIMIPLNIVESKKDPNSKGSSYFETMTPLFVWDKALWAPVVLSYLFNIIVCFFLWINYRKVQAMRRQYFQTPEYQQSLHARTLLIRHIPPSFRTDEGLLRLTDEVNPTPAIPRATIGRNVKGLPKLMKEHEQVVRQLEEVVAKYFKKPDNLPAKRPTCRPVKSDRAEHGPDKVDAIDYLTDRIRRLESEIKYVRESIDKRNALSYGFASWESIENAHAVAYAARKKHPQGTTILLAPRPNDLIWENLTLTRANRRWKRFLHLIWSTLLTVVWIAPNAMIAVFLSDLSNLGLVWPTFQRELNGNPKLWAAIQGIAAPALTSLIFLILPIIFRRLATRSGDISKTSRERHVIHSLYAFFVFNNLLVFSVFSAVWAFVVTVIDASKEQQNVWDAIRAGQFFGKISSALCQVSPFWVTWLLQRSLGAAIDLVQLVNMVWIWYAKTFLTPTPRRTIEWTAPQPFMYASYYNYFLFYATIALCFATLQPIVLPVTAFYFALDSWLKKYLLLYVFVTKTESGGKYWRLIYNRLVFAVIFSNFVTALIVARGTWDMLYAMVPLPFLMIAFKIYCKRTFDYDMEYYTRTVPTDSEALAGGGGKGGKKVTDRLSSRFGHPALYKPLTTPMVHAKAADALEKILQGRQGFGNGNVGGYSDIAMHSMSSSQPGKEQKSLATADPNTDTAAPFEIVAENQLDFAYFKDRADFRDEYGGGIYGRPEDLISERSHTPKSMFAGNGSPSSSRASSPTPAQFSTYRLPSQHHGSSASLTSLHNAPGGPVPPVPRRYANTPDHHHPPNDSDMGFYKMSSESEQRLLLHGQQPSMTKTPSATTMADEYAALDRWGTDRSGTPGGPGGGGTYDYHSAAERRDASPSPSQNPYSAYRPARY